jgi:hypothetical protein
VKSTNGLEQSNNSRTSKRSRGRKRSQLTVPDTDNEYRVGPGHPPKQYQFKKGQSGNPNGAKRKVPALALDLKALLERALNEREKVGDREREKIVTKAQAGIEELVDQFATGDRHARRDLMDIAEKLGIDLTAGHRDTIERSLAVALTPNDQALVDDFIQHYLAERNHSADCSDPKIIRSEDPCKTDPEREQCNAPHRS